MAGRTRTTSRGALQSPPCRGNRACIRDLTGLGLTTYEAKAYVALLGRDSFTAAQVARQGQLPRQRIYDVLGSLVEKGLASSRPGSVVKYAAVAPELAIERLVAEQRRSMESLERTAAEMIAELTPAFASGPEHTDPLEYIEVLRDAGAINERFAELQNSVKREILVFTKPPYATPPQENVEGLGVARSHKARSVYEMSVVRRSRGHRRASGRSSRRARTRGSSESLPAEARDHRRDDRDVRDAGPGRIRAAT